ncbi:C-type lectin domain family 4 member A-like [Otolemur garnettii]|uniref:C-type lectin domain family 4 member A-like n=1 Tax=Otolemur garnettii TaxID=30611 RepID=UPI0002741A65|nr:C-type lectin domain family 4 member A-like [Otolemur garnettii]
MAIFYMLGPVPDEVQTDPAPGLKKFGEQLNNQWLPHCMGSVVQENKWPLFSFLVFFETCSQLPEGKTATKEMIHTTLECVKNNLTITEKVWSCCPKRWMSFSSKCYFISTELRSWNESQKNCSEMRAHLLVINTKEEQDFIIQNLNKNFAYFVGLSDPEGQRHWEWVDQTPYNDNAT